MKLISSDFLPTVLFVFIIYMRDINNQNITTIKLNSKGCK